MSLCIECGEWGRKMLLKWHPSVGLRNSVHNSDILWGELEKNISLSFPPFLLLSLHLSPLSLSLFLPLFLPPLHPVPFFPTPLARGRHWKRECILNMQMWSSVEKAKGVRLLNELFLYFRLNVIRNFSKGKKEIKLYVEEDIPNQCQLQQCLNSM